MDSGLSLQQAPPLSVPARFFLTAPLFGIAAALLLLANGETMLASRWSPHLLAATHGLVLGFISTMMLGALQQMLPVLAGAVIPRPRLIAALVHLQWVPGVLLLMAAFLLQTPWLFHAAATLLTSALLIFIGAVLLSLWRAESASDSAAGIRHAASGLLITLVFGALLALGLGGALPLWRPGLTNLHLAWGLFGWIAILIAAVAWQVVPMFQITPPYPPWLRLRAARVLMLLLLGKSLLFWPLSGRFGDAIGLVLDVMIAAGLVAFALATLRLQSRARRKVRDSHRDFWRLGMAHLLLATGLWLAGKVTGNESLQLFAATAFLLGFAVSVITGMLLKIIAFLLWLHLQSLRDALLQAGKEAFSVPKMKAVIPARHADRLLFMLIAAQLAIGFAIALPGYGSIPAALLWLLHFGYLGVMASHALYRYHRIRVRVTPHVGAIRPPGTRASLEP